MHRIASHILAISMSFLWVASAGRTAEATGSKGQVREGMKWGDTYYSFQVRKGKRGVLGLDVRGKFPGAYFPGTIRLLHLKNHKGGAPMTGLLDITAAGSPGARAFAQKLGIQNLGKPVVTKTFGKNGKERQYIEVKLLGGWARNTLFPELMIERTPSTDTSPGQYGGGYHQSTVRSASSPSGSIISGGNADSYARTIPQIADRAPISKQNGGRYGQLP